MRARWAAWASLLLFFLPGAAAQMRTPGTVVVRIRDARATPLRVLAIVRLTSNVRAVSVTASTGVKGEAVFERIPSGPYEVEVTAPGYETAREHAVVELSYTHVIVYLRPEALKEAAPPPGPPLLAPKAQREVEQGSKALQENNLKKAQKHLLRALELAPGHPEVNYLVGLLYLQLGDHARAKIYLEKATTLEPKHLGALAALAALLYEEQDWAGSVGALERALLLDPHSWQKHWMLASACYFQGELEKAGTHAERALEFGEDEAPEVRLFLGQILLALDQWEQAAHEIETFLHQHAEHAQAGAAQQLLEHARAQRQAELLARSTEPPRPMAALSQLMASLPGVGAYIPPDVDAAQPAVARDVSCSLPDVLRETSQRAAALVDALQHFSATERVELAELEGNGSWRSAETQTFNYTASIREVRPGALAVEELREGRSSFASYHRRASLAALGVIFHPYYVDDFEMRCEGLGHWRGQPVWQVYFRQRPDRRPRIHSYKSNRGRFPARLKGRAWVAANSYNILRVEADLLEPIQQAALDREHFAIEYGPVEFPQRAVQLWLPVSADLYLEVRGRRYRHHHTFSDYLLFAVDVDERVQRPRNR